VTADHGSWHDAATMRVTILGSGTAVPSFERFPSGVLVESCGLTVLVDLGPGVLRRAAQAGVSPGDVDLVLLTHYHTDHTADLAALLFALRNPGFRGRRPLTVAAAGGLERFVRKLTEAWPWLDPQGGYELVLREIDRGRHPFTGPEGELVVHAERIRHTAQSLAYRLEEPDGTAACFSGDADECPELVAIARGSHLFVCDAAFPDEARTEGHLTPGSAGAHAAAAGVPFLVPTHFYPECEGIDLVGQARRTFGADGEIVLAQDLMRFEGADRVFRCVGRPPGPFSA